MSDEVDQLIINIGTGGDEARMDTTVDWKVKLGNGEEIHHRLKGEKMFWGKYSSQGGGIETHDLRIDMIREFEIIFTSLLPMETGNWTVNSIHIYAVLKNHDSRTLVEKAGSPLKQFVSPLHLSTRIE